MYSTQKLERSKTVFSAIFALGLMTAPASAETGVEVMHFWTSGGEAAALGVVKDKVEQAGVTWNDAPVVGGGGENAKTAMRARISAGNPPTAMLLLGHNIKEWAEAGFFADLQKVAAEENWDAEMTDAAKAFTKVEGQWVGAPTNIHRVNMVWASKSAFDAIGADQPASWAEFNALIPKFQEAGIIPLAHGGQPWQDVTLFDNVALGLGGVDFYRKAFIELDPEALGGETMKAVFDQMRVLAGAVDENFSGRDWNLATTMVMNGEAAMQIMGDWAKGEFSNADKEAGADFLCFASPGTAGKFTYLINSFSMFEQADAAALSAQTELARAITDKEVQRKFNIAKGSIPAVKGVATDGFDACALKSMSDLDAASASGTLVPTVAYTHTAPASVVGAITDVVTQHFNTDMSSEEAVAELVDAVEGAL